MRSLTVWQPPPHVRQLVWHASWRNQLYQSGMPGTRAKPAIELPPAGAPGEPSTLGTTDGTLVVSTIPEFLRQQVAKKQKTTTAAVSVITLLSQRCSHSPSHARCCVQGQSTYIKEIQLELKVRGPAAVDDVGVAVALALLPLVLLWLSRCCLSCCCGSRTAGSRAVVALALLPLLLLWLSCCCDSRAVAIASLTAVALVLSHCGFSYCCLS